MPLFEIAFGVCIFGPELLERTHLLAGYRFGTAPRSLEHIGETLNNHTYQRFGSCQIEMRKLLLTSKHVDKYVLIVPFVRFGPIPMNTKFVPCSEDSKL